MTRKSRFAFYPLVLPALALYLVVIIEPALSTIVFGFGNFAGIFADSVFRASLTNSILIGAASAVFQAPLGMLLAYILSRRCNRVSGLLQGALLLPAFAAPALAGLFGRFRLSALPLPPLCTVFILVTWIYTGFFTSVFLAAMNRIDESILEAAKIDGAGEWRIFRSIILPVLRPLIILCVLSAAVFSFRTFDVVFAMNGGSRGSPLLSLYIFSRLFDAGDPGGAAAAASLFLPLSALLLFGVALIRRGGRR